ncbi:MAG: hypothetical protein LZF62_380006 [Nitrospira sp.]|nr:MAG: hypothetical protein LZF62_380006 [Nitrospira sp.]
MLQAGSASLEIHDSFRFLRFSRKRHAQQVPSYGKTASITGQDLATAY